MKSLNKVYLFLCALFALLLLGTGSAFALTATISENGTNDWSGLNTTTNTVTWPGVHVTFTISGGPYALDDDHLLMYKNRTMYISWDVDDDYTINVTKVTMKGYSTLEGFITLGTVTSDNLYSLAQSNRTFYSQDLSLSNDDNLTAETSASDGRATLFHIREVTITYTIEGEEQMAMFDGTEDWGSTDKNYSPSAFEVEKSHVTFSLKSPMKQYNKYDWWKFKSHEYFYLDADGVSELSWQVNEGYTIAVKTLSIHAKGNANKSKGYLLANSSTDYDHQLKLGEGTGEINLAINCSTQYAIHDRSFSRYMFGADGTPFGNNGKFFLKATSKEYDFYQINLTYSISPKTYVITLDSEGGSDGSENVTMTFDSNAHDAITNPTLDGCTFEGWYSGDNGTGDLVIDADGVLQENVEDYTGTGGIWTRDEVATTLYAKWSGVPYSVRFNGNGRTAGSMSNQDFTYGTAQNLTTNAYTKTCTVTYNANGGSCTPTSTIASFSFAGWSTTADGEVVYANSAEVSNLTTTEDDVVDLYAKWSAEADTIVLPTPTKDGYVFLGWYNSSSALVGDAGGPYVATGDVTLTARWIQALTSTVNKPTLLKKFDDSNKKVSWSTEHVTFTLAGDGLKAEWWGSTRFYFYADNSKTWQYDLTWTIDDKDAEGNSAYTISVKKVTFDIERASGLGTYMTIEGRRSGNIYANGNIPSGGISSGTLSKGENEAITTLIETSEVFYSNIVLNNITVIYTLEPVINVASEQSVEVTLCDASKQLLDLSTCASLADESGHAELNYTIIGDNAANAHKTDDNKFYADVIDTYRVRASVNAVADCHSDNTVEFTINVTPATLELTAPTAGNIIYPATLASSTLTGGSAMIGSCEVEGTWAWQTSSTKPSVGNGQSFPVVFTPSEHAEYYANFVTNATVNVLAYVFTGEGDDDEKANIWTKEDNWNVDDTPTIDNIVVIRHDVIIASEVSAYSVEIEEGYTLTIAPEGGLTVGEGGVIGATKDNLKLKAQREGATKGKTGYLRVHPSCVRPMPNATVELFTTAYYDMNATDHQEMGKWQFIGIPVEGGAKAKTVFAKSWLYNWDTESEEWKNNRKTLTLQPFEGYATSQLSYEDGMCITFEGQLVSKTNKTFTLDYNEGAEFTHNMIANSYSAPIDITKFQDTDFSNMQSAVYVFNTGSRDDIKKLAELRSGDSNTPGQYLSIPIGSAAAMKGAFETPTVIASMQGFCVHATAAGATLTLDYNKLVYNAENANAPLHVAAREPERINALCVSLYGEGIADNLYMLESDQYDTIYENGYDAKKMMSGEGNIFAIEGNDHLAVDATSSMIGTRIGVRTGDTTAYIMTFTHLQSDDYLALLDRETNQLIDIYEGMEYTFFAVPNSEITARFQIVESANAPAVTTGTDEIRTESKAQKFIQNGQLFILKNGVLYDAMGKVVR